MSGRTDCLTSAHRQTEDSKRRVEGVTRCCGAVRVIPYAGTDGEEVAAGIDQRSC